MTEEECLGIGGHCWEYSVTPAPELLVDCERKRCRTCKHCGKFEVENITWN